MPHITIKENFKEVYSFEATIIYYNDNLLKINYWKYN